MKCKTCGHRRQCDQCEHYKQCETYLMCEFCEHRKYGGHRWEIIHSRKTCAIFGLISRDMIIVNDDRLVFWANMTKRYVPKPRKSKK